MSSARELHVGVPTLNPLLPSSKSCFPGLCKGEKRFFSLQRASVIPGPNTHSSVLPLLFASAPSTGHGT